MATDDRFIAFKRGAGNVAAQVRVSQTATFTVAGNTTLKISVVVPRGSLFRGIQVETPAAVGGTPDTVYFRCGTTDTGQEVVADVDAKAQGHIAATVVAALNKVTGFSASDTTLFLELITAGGTSSTGTVYAFVDYDAPVF